MFSVDYLLPIRIHEDWIGVVYRNGVPTQALMDVYVNPVMTSTPTTSAMPPLAPYPLNADRFDLNAHYLLTYLCLKFFSDFKLTSVIMTPFQFLGAFASVVSSSSVQCQRGSILQKRRVTISMRITRTR